MLRIRLICLGGIKGPLVIEDLDGLVEVETQMDGRTSTQTRGNSEDLAGDLQ